MRTAKIKGGAVTAAKLHKNAVKAAKIQNGAVVTNKLKNGAVTGDKVADGTLSGAKINASSTPFSQVVEKLRGNSSIPFTGGQVYPFNNATYTQPTGRDDQYLAAFDVKFAASCNQPRSAAAYLVKDAANPGAPGPPEILGFGLAIDKGTGDVTRRANFGALLPSRRSDVQHRSDLIHESHLLGVPGGSQLQFRERNHRHRRGAGCDRYDWWLGEPLVSRRTATGFAR